MNGDSALGERIRRRRKKKGLSLRALGEEIGVTASFLSQIERDLASPSISTLRRIAEALDTPLFQFLIDTQAPSPVVRRGERIQIKLPHSQLTYDLLTPDLNRKMEVFLGELDPDNSNIATPLSQPTEECIVVLQGELEIQLEDGAYQLEAGDSIYFEGVLLRELRSIGEEKLVFVSAITPPVF
jgi:transcriptional regulator with XRE-family HTH domain